MFIGKVLDVGGEDLFTALDQSGRDRGECLVLGIGGRARESTGRGLGGRAVGGDVGGDAGDGCFHTTRVPFRLLDTREWPGYRAP